MSPVQTLTRNSRITLGTAISCLLVALTFMAGAYKVKFDLERSVDELRGVNAVQDGKIDRSAQDIGEIKADVKELLRRSKP
jgi:hypothetical protein